MLSGGICPPNIKKVEKETTFLGVTFCSANLCDRSAGYKAEIKFFTFFNGKPWLKVAGNVASFTIQEFQWKNAQIF